MNTLNLNLVKPAAPVSSPAPALQTFADAIAAVKSQSGWPKRRRRELIHVLRFVARVIGKDPAAIPFDPTAIDAAVTGKPPGEYGLDATRLQNLLSDLRDALRGQRPMP